MKFLLTFCLISAFISYVSANEVVYGKRVPGDQLLYRVDVSRSSTKGFSHDVYVSYPKKGAPSQDKEITAIYVKNKHLNAASHPVLADDVGKVWSGLKEVRIILRGQLSKGIETEVKFFGK